MASLCDVRFVSCRRVYRIYESGATDELVIAHVQRYSVHHATSQGCLATVEMPNKNRVMFITPFISMNYDFGTEIVVYMANAVSGHL